MSLAPNPDGPKTAKSRTYSYDTLIPQDGNEPKRSPTFESPTLRYRHRALWLLAFYLPLLCVPWILTCLLAYKPAVLWSYQDHSGLSLGVVTTHRRLMDALSVLNSFTSIITIPVISALLAQAAVVYTQRRKRQQVVSVRQAFALADRGWSNLSILFEAWPPWKSSKKGQPSNGHGSSWNGAGSAFLWLGAGFLLICGVQQPVREALVSNEQVLVMSWPDSPAAIGDAGVKVVARVLGFDPEPDDLTSIPEDLVVQTIVNDLALLTKFDKPSNLWLEGNRLSDDGQDLSDTTPYDRLYGQRVGPWVDGRDTYFVAAQPSNTTTGVLRNRAIRFSSTVKCTNSLTYPDICSGEAPFEASFGQQGQFEAKICVAGQQGIFPWTISRNKQTVNETVVFYVDGVFNGSRQTLTQTCNVVTDRGYFELGNYYNEYVHGPLLDQWLEPDVFSEQAEFNDYLSDLWRDGNVVSEGRVIAEMGKRRRPSVEDRNTDIPGWSQLKHQGRGWPVTPGANHTNKTISGPLMTAIISMFGERSTFALANSSLNNSATHALSSICQDGRMPFSAFNDHTHYKPACENAIADPDKALLATMSSLMFDLTTTTDDIFSPIPAERYLAAAVSLTNLATLHHTVQKTTPNPSTARPLRTAPGVPLTRPIVSLPAAIIVSLLLFTQLLGLAYLAHYIYQVPTWTAQLDALAVARIAASLDRADVPALGALWESDVQRLGGVSAVVGVVEEEEGGAVGSVEADADAEGRKTVELGLGASGVFHRGLVRFRVKRKLMDGNVEMQCRCEGCRRLRGAGQDASSSVSSLQ